MIWMWTDVSTDNSTQHPTQTCARPLIYVVGVISRLLKSVMKRGRVLSSWLLRSEEDLMGVPGCAGGCLESGSVKDNLSETAPTGHSIRHSISNRSQPPWRLQLDSLTLIEKPRAMSTALPVHWGVDCSAPTAASKVMKCRTCHILDHACVAHMYHSDL